MIAFISCHDQRPTTNDSGLSPEVVGGSTGRTGLAACPSYVFGSLASGVQVLFGFERLIF